MFKSIRGVSPTPSSSRRETLRNPAKNFSKIQARTGRFEIFGADRDPIYSVENPRQKVFKTWKEVKQKSDEYESYI